MELDPKFNLMLFPLNEKQKRIYLASEAVQIGYGGISKVSNLSGVSRVVITKGIKELTKLKSEPTSSSRKQG
ncbi:MAG: hypothetical protein M0P92_04630 [Acholeplasmataceae bacterium]|jgi:hypothetical protein|nr:hypothetical protein [Acholeplasmataceae bacterium]